MNEYKNKHNRTPNKRIVLDEREKKGQQDYETCKKSVFFGANNKNKEKPNIYT